MVKQQVCEPYLGHVVHAFFAVIGVAFGLGYRDELCFFVAFADGYHQQRLAGQRERLLQFGTVECGYNQA